MNFNTLLISIVFCIFIILFISFLVIKKKIRIKYALVWISLFFLIFLMLIIPGFLSWITNLFGFQTPANFTICIIIGILVIINIVNTTILSTQNKKIKKLIQVISIMEKNINNFDEKHD